MIQHRLLALVLPALLATGCGGAEQAPPDRERPTAAASSAAAVAPVPSVELGIHPVLGAGDPAAVTTEADPAQEATVLDDEGQPLRIGPAALSAADVASADVEQRDGVVLITVDFTGDGARRWEALTGQAACRPPGDPTRRVAILAGGEVLSSPQVDPSVECGVGIQGGSTQIAGDFSKAQAMALVRGITGG